MKFLILFLFSVNIYAGYASKSRLLNPDCETPKPFYKKISDCNKNHSDCILFPETYHCPTFSELDTSVDDKEKPKHSKNEIEVCANQSDCESKLPLKICADETENKYINSGYSEIYCSKLTGYDQKIVKRIREDSAKKAAYDNAMASEEALEKARSDEAAIIKTKLKDGLSLSQGEIEKLLLYLSR